MTKISILEQLKQADAEGYAIPHFNYSDIWDMTAIVRAAEEMHSPVMLAGVPKVTNALTMDTVAAMAHSLADNAKVPVYLHLDHSTDPQICKDACDHHFDTVMIDGSKESLERNIEMTADVVSYAHPRGIFVEGEIGKIEGCRFVESTEAKKVNMQTETSSFRFRMRSSLCRVPALTFLPSASARRTASIRESRKSTSSVWPRSTKRFPSRSSCTAARASRQRMSARR